VWNLDDFYSKIIKAFSTPCNLNDKLCNNTHIRRVPGDCLLLVAGSLVGIQYVAGRTCDRPPRHTFFIVFLWLQASAEFPISSDFCTLRMHSCRFKCIKINFLTLKDAKFPFQFPQFRST